MRNKDVNAIQQPRYNLIINTSVSIWLEKDNPGNISKKVTKVVLITMKRVESATMRRFTSGRDIKIIINVNQSMVRIPQGDLNPTNDRIG